MPTPLHRTTARRWLRHALDSGARFDVGAKYAASIEACATMGTRTFVVPSKLAHLDRAGVAALSHAMATHPAGGPVLLTLTPRAATASPEGVEIVASLPRGPIVGHVQTKHTCWLLPLLDRGVALYATAITGGTPERPSRGVNVVVAGLDAALAPRRPPCPAERGESPQRAAPPQQGKPAGAKRPRPGQRRTSAAATSSSMGRSTDHGTASAYQSAPP